MICSVSKASAGFSLVEVVVMTTILAVMAILVFIQLRAVPPTQALASATNVTRSALVLQRSYAYGGHLCCNDQLPSGYGVVVTLDGQPDNTITLYADLDASFNYTPSDEVLSDTTIGTDVDVTACQDDAVVASDTCDILFSTAGDQLVYFNGSMLVGIFDQTFTHAATTTTRELYVYGSGIIE